jgi:hypothetical protein
MQMLLVGGDGTVGGVAVGVEVGWRGGGVERADVVGVGVCGVEGGEVVAEAVVGLGGGVAAEGWDDGEGEDSEGGEATG